LISALEGTTGVRVVHYAQLRFAGLGTLTDSLGGIVVHNRQAYANGGFTFPAGRQPLNGQAALAYLRRSDPSACPTATWSTWRGASAR
jgi:anionic cell wall polymer biosynthesis LytR-Cps2A-Psr (LCP) family protein